MFTLPPLIMKDEQQYEQIPASIYSHEPCYVNINLTGGIVISKNGVLYINANEKYDHKETNNPLVSTKEFLN